MKLKDHQKNLSKILGLTSEQEIKQRNIVINVGQWSNDDE